jgi:hypothetical protein
MLKRVADLAEGIQSNVGRGPGRYCGQRPSETVLGDWATASLRMLNSELSSQIVYNKEMTFPRLLSAEK